MNSFYSVAETNIKCNKGITESVRVTRGVLQGEVLSPHEFLLFINDFEDHFYKQGCRGIAINSKTDVMTQGYADDYVLLSDSPLEVSNN